MAERLAGSLLHILEQAGDAAGLSPEQRAGLASRLDRRGPFRPGDFGAYNDILRAISGDDGELLRHSFQRLCQAPEPGSGPVVIGFSEGELGPLKFDSYRRFAAADTDIPMPLRAPTAQELTDLRQRVDEAMAWFGELDSAFAAEIGEIGQEVIAAPPDQTLTGNDYGGISIFEMWGAVFMNPNRVAHSTPETALGLVHEVTHHLLFTFCTDERLTLNDPRSRYRSPLRDDKRPLEGIFHATFVVARMHLAARQILDFRGLAGAEADRIAATLPEYESKFADGVSVVREHGDLTATGDEVMAGAEAYMARAA